MSINERKDKTGRIQEVDLGLDASQQQALGECRRAVSSDAELDDLRDATLVRFLRNNSFAVEPTVAQLKRYMAWRVANNVDKILDNPRFPSMETIRTIIPYAYHNTDNDGRPVYIEFTGALAAAALADSVICPPDHLMHSHIYGVEFLQRCMYESSLKTGKRVNGICTILDFNGLGFGHRSCLGILQTLLAFDKETYPEYLGKLYVINVPWVGPYLYSAVTPFLDEVTKARLQLVSGDPSEFLLAHIPADNLPAQYGGTCTGDKCNHGGMGHLISGLKGCCDVLDASALKPAGAPDDAGLSVADISYDLEKEVTALNEGDVFTWYFEVTDQMDIDFSVELLPASGKREADAAKKVYIKAVERLKTGQGNFKAPFAGAKLLFRWDNNFSWMYGKKVKFQVEAQPATEQLNQLVGGAAAGASSAQ